jgi:plastocyanin
MRGLTNFGNLRPLKGETPKSAPVPGGPTGTSGMKENRMRDTTLRVAFVGLALVSLLGTQTSCDNACPSCSRDESEGTTKRPGSPDIAGSSANPTVAKASAVFEQKVGILDFTFEPATLTVAPGTQVTWVNKDDEPHTATSSEKPKRFDSGVLDTAQAYSFVFSEAGSFTYFCKLHPHMTGVIVVK